MPGSQPGICARPDDASVAGLGERQVRVCMTSACAALALCKAGSE